MWDYTVILDAFFAEIAAAPFVQIFAMVLVLVIALTLIKIATRQR